MARKPRIHFPGAIYHVILRGNGGQEIFFSDQDRFTFYSMIEVGIERYGHQIHAFCLMTNHMHLVVQVGDVPLAKIIQNLSVRYTGYINRRLDRNGHLFQGRYKALLIDAENYLLELVRYTHNNPVRAGLVKDPVQYQWSSHRTYLNEQRIIWLTQDFVLSKFDNRVNKARYLFDDFCRRGIKEKHREEFHKGSFDGRIIGDDSFSKKVLISPIERPNASFDLDQLIKEVCRVYRLDKNEIIAPGKRQPGAEARAVAAYLTQEIATASLTELGEYLRRDVSAMSRAASRIRDRLKDDHDLSDKVIGLKKGLT